jgi:YD repeat-containing protein
MNKIEEPLFVVEEVPIRNELVRRLHIESITGESFNIKNHEPSASRFKSHLLTYDRSGNRRNHWKYDPEGAVVYEWVYDLEGRPLKEVAYHAKSQVNYEFRFIYDHQENWREKKMYVHGNQVSYVIIPDRDARGMILNGHYYDSSGRRIRTDSYIYDDRNRLVRISMGHMGEWIYEYDENSNLKSKSGNSPSADVYGETFEFQYDDRWLLKRMNHLHRSATEFEYTFFG